MPGTQKALKRRTTLTLPSDSLAQAQKIAVMRRVNLSTVISEVVSAGLEIEMPGNAAARFCKITVKPFRVFRKTNWRYWTASSLSPFAAEADGGPVFRSISLRYKRRGLAGPQPRARNCPLAEHLSWTSPDFDLRSYRYRTNTRSQYVVATCPPGGPRAYRSGPDCLPEPTRQRPADRFVRGSGGWRNHVAGSRTPIAATALTPARGIAPRKARPLAVRRIHRGDRPGGRNATRSQQRRRLRGNTQRHRADTATVPRSWALATDSLLAAGLRPTSEAPGLARARDHFGLEALKPKYAATLKQIRENYLVLPRQTGQTTAAAELEKRIQSALRRESRHRFEEERYHLGGAGFLETS